MPSRSEVPVLVGVYAVMYPGEASEKVSVPGPPHLAPGLSPAPVVPAEATLRWSGSCGGNAEEMRAWVPALNVYAAVVFDPARTG